MVSGSRELPPPKFLQIKQNDKFFSRLLSKESSKQGESSFRVLYYGGAAGSIPFTWESQPGTPKHPSSENYVPPLTPPPSYQFSTPNMKTMQKTKNSNSKSKFLSNIFPRISSKKTAPKSASFSSSSYSSSESLPSTPSRYAAGRRNNDAGMQRSRSAIQFGEDEEYDEKLSTSPTSTLCFGSGNKSAAGKIGSSRPMKILMKKAFLSIVGQGPA